MKKIIEVNLGIGLNQFFPEPVKILVQDDDTDENQPIETNDQSKNSDDDQ